MRTLSKKQKAIVGGVAVAVLGTSGVAYAYWTTGGSGTGTASTIAGAANQLALIDADTATPSDMAPGIAPGAISVVVKNTSPTSNYHVASVKVSIASVEAPAADATHPCGKGDYKFLDTSAATVAGTGNVTMTNGAADLTVADGDDNTGTDQSAFSGVKIGFNNTASNQDGCKGATVHLQFDLA